MLRTLINLESYPKLEKAIKKLNGCAKDRLIFYDTQSSSVHIKPLETYLNKMFTNIDISIVDISALPKDAKICLIARKDESI
jgi:hypothetical protein